MPRKTRAAVKAEQVVADNGSPEGSPVLEKEQNIAQPTDPVASDAQQLLLDAEEEGKKTSTAKKNKKRKKKQPKKANKSVEDAPSDEAKGEGEDDVDEEVVEQAAGGAIAANDGIPANEAKFVPTQALPHDSKDGIASDSSAIEAQAKADDSKATKEEAASIIAPKGAKVLSNEVSSAKEMDQNVADAPTGSVLNFTTSIDKTQQEMISPAEDNVHETAGKGANQQEEAPKLDLPTPPESNADTNEAAQHDAPVPKDHSTGSSSATSGASALPKSPIEAMDALEDEIEEVQKVLPVLEDSPVTPKAAKAEVTTTPSTTGEKAASKQVPHKSKISKTTTSKLPDAKNNGVARTSSIRKGPANKPITTTQPPALSRSTATRPVGSVAKPARNPLAASTTVRPRPSSIIASTASKAPSTAKSGEDTEPKKRPISISFPAPPAPIKSTKPVTKASFTLPGEAVAAKLKAQKEARLKKEEEEEDAKGGQVPKLKPISSHTKGPVIPGIRPTAASRARHSIAAAGKGGDPKVGSQKPLKSPLTSQGPTSEGAGRAGAATKPLSKPTETKTTISTKRMSMLAMPKRTVIAKESDTTSAGMSSLSKSTTSNPTVVPQRGKGREVFNRERVDTETRDRERKEKEDKAKKARVEAAERSRQLSREYREKQKRKQDTSLKAKPENSNSPAADAQPLVVREGMSV